MNTKAIIQNIDIKKIKVAKNRREAPDEKIKELAESIKSLGLINPIVVDDENNLVAGLHRLRAFELLGYDKIKASVYSKNSDYMKMIEIDENLRRNEIHYLERADILNERQQIYEKLFPTKAASKFENGKATLKGVSATVAPSFTEDTAIKTGLSQRSVQLDVQLSKNLDDSIKDKVISGKLDIDKNDILKISRKDEGDQKKIVKLMEKEDMDVKTAIKVVEKTIRKKEIEKTNPKKLEDLEIMEKLGIKLELYNVWNVAKRDLGFGKEHFGNQPADMIFNLLYYFTEHKDLVWDVCAGGGVVNDVCEKFNRKCYSTDLMPTRKEIKELDIVKDALPDIEPQFIFFDPPYHLQAKGQYSESPKDLANMSIEDFYESMEKFFNKMTKKYKDFYFAFIISSTQWPNEDKHIEPHALKFYEMLNKNMDFVHHIIVPYSTSQYVGSMVEVAKDKKIIMNLHRDLMVFKSKK